MGDFLVRVIRAESRLGLHLTYPLSNPIYDLGPEAYPERAGFFFHVFRHIERHFGKQMSALRMPGLKCFPDITF